MEKLRAAHARYRVSFPGLEDLLKDEVRVAGQAAHEREGKDGFALIDDAPRDVQCAAPAADHHCRVAAGDRCAFPGFDVIHGNDTFLVSRVARQGQAAALEEPVPAQGNLPESALWCFLALLERGTEAVCDPVVDSGRIAGDEAEASIGQRHANHARDAALGGVGPSGADDQNEFPAMISHCLRLVRHAGVVSLAFVVHPQMDQVSSAACSVR
jgi:hypothetical protein